MKVIGTSLQNTFVNTLIVSLALSFFTLTGCKPVKHKITIDDLDSRYPTHKIQAARLAAENKHMHAVPQLVKLLEDEDRSVRFYAIKALINLVGLDHGYDYKADWEKRAEAVQLWKDFLVNNKDKFKIPDEDKVDASVTSTREP